MSNVKHVKPRFGTFSCEKNDHVIKKGFHMKMLQNYILEQGSLFKSAFKFAPL